MGIKLKLKNLITRSGKNNRFHFVDDYERLVKRFIRKYPIDEAMSRAVGGAYEEFGQLEANILISNGLCEGMRVVDLGCGSGRLASKLHASTNISYVGTDVVRQLLDYAKTKAPTYEFILHRKLSIPQQDRSADMVCAFSLFTHLLHEESFLYLEECWRILKPGGKVIFSFLEFSEPYHWDIFMKTKQAAQDNRLLHLNVFIERSVITTWAEKLGFVINEYVSATSPVWDKQALGQSIVILSKPR